LTEENFLIKCSIFGHKPEMTPFRRQQLGASKFPLGERSRDVRNVFIRVRWP